MSAITTLKDLLKALDTPTKDTAAFNTAMNSLKCSREEFAQFAHYSETGYTRNLISRNDHYELIALCWKQGQVSPIHDHQGQNCWMYVVDGLVSETIFTITDLNYTDGTLKMDQEAHDHIEKSTTVYKPGTLGHITDDKGFHRICNAHKGLTISLHLYSLPFESCLIYDQGSKLVTRKQLQYFSIDGELVEAA